MPGSGIFRCIDDIGVMLGQIPDAEALVEGAEHNAASPEILVAGRVGSGSRWCGWWYSQRFRSTVEQFEPSTATGPGTG